MISYNLNLNSMELVTRILDYISLIWITDTVEQQYIMTENGNKVSNWAKVRYRSATRFCFGTVNLKIKFNNFITNSSYTKFLGVTMDNTLSWNNHIDLLVKKLSTACYIIRNAKTYMSASSSKMIYYAFFHSAMSYGIIFWGSSSHSSVIFRLQKKAIRIMEGCGN
jgi:hypothetical protein